MRRGEWIKRSLLALIVLVAGDAPLVATPLDKSACTALVSELEALVSTGLRDDIERGPEWAKKNLSNERVRNALRLLEVEDQIEFRCHKRYWPARSEQVAIPLPQRAPASIRPRIAQPANQPESPPNIGAENSATDRLMAPAPAAQAPAGNTPASGPAAPAALSAATDPAIEVPAQAPQVAPLVSGKNAPPAGPRGDTRKNALPPELLAADRSKKNAAAQGSNRLKNKYNMEDSHTGSAIRPAESRIVRGFKPAAVKVPSAAASTRLARLVVAEDPFIEVPPVTVGIVGALNGSNAMKTQDKNSVGAGDVHPDAGDGGGASVALPVVKPATAEAAADQGGGKQAAEGTAPPPASRTRTSRRRSAARGYVRPDEVAPYALPGMRF